MTRYVAAFVFVLVGFAAQAHVHWISRLHPGCCGEKDCVPVEVQNVRIVAGGYFLVETAEFIKHEDARESEDGRYWRCMYTAGINTGKTRCFFRGLPGV